MEPETRVEFANIHVCCGIWLDGFILRFQSKGRSKCFPKSIVSDHHQQAKHFIITLGLILINKLATDILPLFYIDKAQAIQHKRPKSQAKRKQRKNKRLQRTQPQNSLSEKWSSSQPQHTSYGREIEGHVEAQSTPVTNDRKIFTGAAHRQSTGTHQSRT
ncbi:hypothetical protein YC2023_061104 [Brassica napus]